MTSHIHARTVYTGARRSRSILWSLVLLPFFVTPYRWLWLPCAAGAVLTLAWPKQTWRQRLHQDHTMILGAPLLLIVRTALDPTFWIPWVGIALLALIVRSRVRWTQTRALTATLAATISAFLILDRPSLVPWLVRHSPVDPATVLVCAGDSLTSGVDLDNDSETYVARLRADLGCSVINAGFPGDTTADLLARLDRDILAHRPTAVLLCIGGNDYLNGVPRADFAGNLEHIVSRICAVTRNCVLVEVPSGMVWNPYAGVYRRIARRHGCVLVPESNLRRWLAPEMLAHSWLPQPMTLDGIHLSPHGASVVARWLRPYVLKTLSSDAARQAMPPEL